MKKANEPSDKVASADAHGQIIPIVEEVVQLGKEIVEKGTIRVVKKVDEETINVPSIARSQSYSIERVPLNQYVERAPPAIRQEGKVMIISVVEEEVVVQKRLKVVEELRITLSEHETESNTKVKVRKERIDVQRSGSNE